MERHSFSQWTLVRMHCRGSQDLAATLPGSSEAYHGHNCFANPVVWGKVPNVVFVVVLMANMVNNLPYESASYNLLEMVQALCLFLFMVPKVHRVGKIGDSMMAGQSHFIYIQEADRSNRRWSEPIHLQSLYPVPPARLHILKIP